MASCFKIVRKDHYHEHIEISHPPEAIEEISRPVYDEYSSKKIGYIKLHRCKLCGMVILDKG